MGKGRALNNYVDCKCRKYKNCLTLECILVRKEAFAKFVKNKS